jgi:putative nucleotidyltransferase with HDIG domain
VPVDERTLASLIESARAAERAGDWEEALERYGAAYASLDDRDDAGRAAELLRWIGTVHRQRGSLELATESYEASLAAADVAGLREHVAAALNCLGIIEQQLGRLDSAGSFYARARALAEGEGAGGLAAMIDQNLGILANIRGDVEGALLHYGSALEQYRRIGDDLAAARALNNMGMAYVDLAKWGAAEICFDEAFRLADRVQDADTLGSVDLNRAELYLKRRDFARARESCDRAFEVFSRLQSDSEVAEAYKFYGVLYRETAKPQLAETHLLRALELARECKNPLLEAEAESERALLYLTRERNREALQCLNRAHQLFGDLEARREISDLNGRLDGLEEIYLRVVRAWGESIESKDQYTAGHCQRVADYACMLAEAVGFAGRDLTWFRMGGFLHDVGKIEVPGEVLNKPGKLTPEEWKLMQGHTTAGDAIVAELNFAWDIRPIVRSHHEHWAGTGYPDGLKGEEIPLTARILCVADIYDALTTTRSYRPALSREEALRIMEADSGRILDPTLFEVFRTLLQADAQQ